jgi:hypothetical protein
MFFRKQTGRTQNFSVYPQHSTVQPQRQYSCLPFIVYKTPSGVSVMLCRQRQTFKEFLAVYFPNLGGIPLPKFQKPKSLGFCQHDPGIRSTWQRSILFPIISFPISYKGTESYFGMLFIGKWYRWGVLIVSIGITSYWSAERGSAARRSVDQLFAGSIG